MNSNTSNKLCHDILPASAGPLRAVFLTFLSYKLGPHTQRVWLRSDTAFDSELRQEKLYQDLGKISFRSRIRQEDENRRTDSTLDLEWFSLPSQNCSLLIASYSSILPDTRKTERQPVSVSLGFIWPVENFDVRLLAWRPALETLLRRDLPFLRVKQDRGEDWIYTLDHGYAQLALEVDKLTRKLANCALALRSPVDRTRALSPALAGTAFAPEFNMEDDLLCEAISGHLMTRGHSLVVGCSNERIDLMLKTLALFMTSEEKYLCCLMKNSNSAASENCDRRGTSREIQYLPDLLLQGTSREAESVFVLSPKLILASALPLCLIDLPARTVELSELDPLYTFQRYCLRRAQLSTLCSGANSDELLAFSGDLLSVGPPVLPGSGSWVSGLVRALRITMDPQLVTEFLSTVDQRAEALVSFVHSAQAAAQLPVKPYKSSEALVSTLRFLEVGCEADARLLVARAERREPGVAAKIIGDPKTEFQKLQDIVDTL